MNMADLKLRIVHAQNDRYYVADYRQNTYGSSNGFATEAEAQAYIEEDDDDT